MMESSVKKVFEERCAQDAGWLDIAIKTKTKLESGVYDKADWFGQFYQRYSYDYMEAVEFAILHSWAWTGDILFCQLELGQSPVQDDMTELNNEMLLGLPKGFSGKFIGGAGDNDGWIKWDMPINLNVFDADGEEHKKTLRPSRCPLEVGYTKFSRTHIHLTMERVLARWPYNSDKIIIMALSDKKIDEVEIRY